MNTTEGRAWRALSGAKGIGSKALWRIAAYLESRGGKASWLLEDPGRIAEALGASKASFELPFLSGREKGEMEKFPGREVTLIHPLHPDFPQRLKVLKETLPLPALLYVRGNIALLDKPGVAIVGKRNANEAALTVAASLASGLAAKGINVVSGYAAGIDTAAHAAALRAGGTTSLVLSEGIHHFQVKAELKDHLQVDNILVVSQFDPDKKWAAYMAMERNKLVCALADAVMVIVSGPERDANGRMSGSFDAGMAALKMGIPAFAVSPEYFSDKPEGNRRLIARGCRAWEPASGTAAIIASINYSAAKKSPRQKSLF
jgi:DNA processing protein